MAGLGCVEQTLLFPLPPARSPADSFLTKALLIHLPRPLPRASITTSPGSKPTGICCGAWSSAAGSSIISCAAS